MGNDLLTYIQRLELIAFFAGYPLIYAIVYTIAGSKYKVQNSFSCRMVKCLPFAYALSGTLFLGLMLKDLYPDYSLNHISDQFQAPYLIAWGISSLLFWIPLFSKKTFLSLLHSFVFFFLLLKDLFMYMNTSIDKEVIQNDMKIYTTSLLVNAATFLSMLLIHIGLNAIRGNKKSS